MRAENVLVDVIQIGPGAPFEIAAVQVVEPPELGKPQEDATVSIESIQVVLGDDFRPA